jgi:glycosyltransferase involved in cell wall biosynthesis
MHIHALINQNHMQQELIFISDHLQKQRLYYQHDQKSIKMPLISVVLNTYNSARFVQETIESALNQSLSDFELIVIDDGSTDSTLKIVSLFKDERIHVYSYRNGGIATSRNRGIEKASAEYIAFLDHDDIWHHEKLNCQLKALQESPQSALAYSWINIIDESGDFVRALSKTHKSGYIHKDLLLKNFFMTASNPLLRKSALVEIGGFDETIYGADDWDLFLRVAERYTVALSPHHHIQYRVVKGSGSGQVEKFEQGCLRVVEKAFDNSDPSIQHIKYSALARIYQFLCFKTLQDLPHPNSAWVAYKYLRKSYALQPDLWNRTNLGKTAAKIGLTIIFPRSIVKKFMYIAVSFFR